jgi:hypothetical protein
VPRATPTKASPANQYLKGRSSFGDFAHSVGSDNHNRSSNDNSSRSFAEAWRGKTQMEIENQQLTLQLDM